MLRQLRRGRSGDCRSGLSIDNSQIALAHVRRERDGALSLATAAFEMDAVEDGLAQKLGSDMGGIDLARSPLTSVMSDSNYQLLHVEVPNVPAEEVNSAVRWQIRDLLDFPADEAVVEVFDMPNQSTDGAKTIAYAVVTQRSNVQAQIDLCGGIGLALDTIDIPELCTRNIATLLPQDKEGVVFLHFTEERGILTVTRQGLLYLTRRIEKGRAAIRSASSDDFAWTELVNTIALEIQRSLDFYESHFDRRLLTELVLAPGSEIGDLATSLNDQLSLNVSSFDLNDLFDVSPDDPSTCLLAVGAALRTDLPPALD